ncbi:FNTA [Cordylochernes scorpioides]|uniref:Protein farnesyltransferase/geranylgeranyltransferase type-1 subunit alpha n=1 Tax=Cordylochernes scorpioides TaxID=51811 RepID=A0ABY6KZY4_9ARAC|nr:FNTA [Cordylochernes scorpioides]
MSDYSSEEDSASEWVMYKDKPEWADIKPIPQDEGPNPIICIAYSDKYKDVNDYLRALLHKNEISERALGLTKEAIYLNPANYTVWQYRRQLLKALNQDLQQELIFINDIIQSTSKNYQVWHHRQVIVELMKDGSKEKPFTEEIIAIDAKHYHAWQHRQWAMKEFGLWDDELSYHTTGFSDPEIMKREIKYTLDAIAKAAHNESPWSYLRGLLGAKLGDEAVVKFCKELLKSGCISPHLMAFLVDVAEEEMESQPAARPALLQEAARLLDDLANEHDTIRRNYYEFIGQNLKAKYGSPGATGDCPS